MLGTESVPERIATLTAIERVLASESMNWTDAGQALRAYIIDVLEEPEEPEPAPVAPPPKQTGWTSAPPPQRVSPQPTPAQPSAPGWASAAAASSPSSVPPWTQQPPRFNKGPDRRCFGTRQDKLALIKDCLTKIPGLSAAHHRNLLALEQCLKMGLSTTHKQQKLLETISKDL
jgi:hypothetical protein